MKRITLAIQESTVRSVIHSTLQGRGFDVQDIASCVHPSDAADCNLDCYSDQEPPDLMILDVLINRACSGVEAAHKGLQRFPGVRILLISATPPLVWPDSARLLFETLPKHYCGFLAKPFTAQQLHAAATALLNGQND